MSFKTCGSENQRQFDRLCGARKTNCIGLPSSRRGLAKFETLNPWPTRTCNVLPGLILPLRSSLYSVEDPGSQSSIFNFPSRY